MVDTDYIVRSGFIVIFILIHAVMLATKILLALLLILIYLIIFGGDLFLTIRKFKGEVILDVVDLQIVEGEESLSISFGVEGPSGGYIPKNYYLDLGVSDGEYLIAEFSISIPAGKFTTVEVEAELFEKIDLAGKTLIVAGDITVMILFIPIPLNKLSEDSFAYLDVVFPEQEFAFAAKEVVVEE
ncbi:MAG: hypothetical protein KAR35_00225 [Candidatus Heimdallarchaeota archaeon]|nr:hypothetical protein [Candidatus Heimdallarchaeota archaeon]MCK5047776.1 hypothetical protein [Candidatus Heimdallarchaeota archaeon]